MRLACRAVAAVLQSGCPSSVTWRPFPSVRAPSSSPMPETAPLPRPGSGRQIAVGLALRPLVAVSGGR